MPKAVSLAVYNDKFPFTSKTFCIASLISPHTSLSQQGFGQEVTKFTRASEFPQAHQIIGYRFVGLLIPFINSEMLSKNNYWFVVEMLV